MHNFSVQHVKSCRALSAVTGVISRLLLLVALSACTLLEPISGSRVQWLHTEQGADLESITLSGNALQAISTNQPGGTSLVNIGTDGKETARLGLGDGVGSFGAIAAANDSSVVVTGSTKIDGTRQCFVKRIDTPLLAPRWSIVFAGKGDQLCRGIAVFADGDVAVVGEFSGSITLGAQHFTGSEHSNMFVARLSGVDGSVRWARHFEGDGNVQMRALAVGHDGTVTVGGQFWRTIRCGGPALSSVGDADALVVKLSGQGAFLWQQQFGDVGFDLVKSIAIASNGDTIVVGPLMRSADYHGENPFFAGVMDGTITRFDVAGRRIWQRVFTGGKSQAHHVALARDGTIWVSGHFRENVDLGGLTFNARGNSDAFVAAFSPLGVPIRGEQFGGADATAYGYALAVGEHVFFGGILTGRVTFGKQQARISEGSFVGMLR